MELLGGLVQHREASPPWHSGAYQQKQQPHTALLKKIRLLHFSGEKVKLIVIEKSKRESGKIRTQKCREMCTPVAKDSPKIGCVKDGRFKGLAAMGRIKWFTQKSEYCFKIGLVVNIVKTTG